jgi:hypothetical protein
MKPDGALAESIVLRIRCLCLLHISAWQSVFPNSATQPSPRHTLFPGLGCSPRWITQKLIFTKYTRHERFTRCICFSFLLPTPSAPRHRTLSRPSITGFGTIPRKGTDGYITSPCRIVLHAWLSCIRLVTRMERRSRIVVVFYLFWRTRTAAPSLSWVWYTTAPSLRRHVFVLSS